jgi:AraC family transcriptional regulator of adaptative response/methylated-DNA-[protein]-cysteine methyltransferase
MPQSATPLLSPSDRLKIAQDDYDHVRKALTFIGTHWRDQPDLEEIASHTGLSSAHLRHLLQRWAGLSPKAFLQAITIEHARTLLNDAASVLETSLELGLSGPGRLHDLFVNHEALSPGEWKSKAAGLDLHYGFHPSPFGEAILVTTPRGLSGLGFVDDGDRMTALADMKRRWPLARFTQSQEATLPFANRIFCQDRWMADQPLRLVFIGSDFEVEVWEALLKIPLGQATTYSDLARHIGRPKAARAVGAAVGRNPISFVVPCHRVLGKSGALTGYHWGIPRKQAMLGWEAGCVSSAQNP